jgi:hypothetical protein
MTRMAKPLSPQLHLALTSAEDLPVVPDPSHELKLALIELLTQAACAPDEAPEAHGGEDDSEAHE